MQIQIGSEDVGKGADILVLLSYKGQIFFRDASFQFKPWDGQINSIAASARFPQLPNQVDIGIFNNVSLSTLPGQFFFLVAYRLDTQVIVYNQTLMQVNIVP